MLNGIRVFVAVAIMSGVASVPAHAAALGQSVTTINRAGAQFALQVAMRSATQMGAPCAVAIVDREGILVAFDRFDDVRPGSSELAMGKARTSAFLARPSEEVEENVDKGRFAFVTGGFMALRGGMPLKIGNDVVGAIGVAGIKKENDVRIAEMAAEAFEKEAAAH